MALTRGEKAETFADQRRFKNIAGSQHRKKHGDLAINVKKWNVLFSSMGPSLF